MASKNLWAIIHAIQRSGEITPRQVRQLLCCDSKKACRLLEHLVSVGAVKNIGQRRHPVYVMQPGGETRIKPFPMVRQKPSVVATPKLDGLWKTKKQREFECITPIKQADTACSCTNGIFQECRNSAAMKRVLMVWGSVAQELRKGAQS
ncbi:hypothetical protein ACI2JI_04520 [Enterobacter cancerogenus]|uniref:hypothetical protein n=1 Tax=Enterobacter cancerogenus TaxID=69218 RepID=UPI00385027A5